MSRAKLALETTMGLVVVCVCVLNLMIVCVALSRQLCGTSPPHKASVKLEIMGRAQISHDAGREVRSSDRPNNRAEAGWLHVAQLDGHRGTQGGPLLSWLTQYENWRRFAHIPHWRSFLDTGV